MVFPASVVAAPCCLSFFVRQVLNKESQEDTATTDDIPGSAVSFHVGLVVVAAVVVQVDTEPGWQVGCGISIANGCSKPKLNRGADQTSGNHLDCDKLKACNLPQG